MHLLHFLPSFYYQAQEIASVSFSLIKKWKSISPSPPPFPYFFHAEECVMNELCLCEVVQIHFAVSSMDFCAGRSLMSLHVLGFCVACVCACLLLPNYVWKHFHIMVCVCPQVHVMCDQSVGLSVECVRPHLQRHGWQRCGRQHHQASPGLSS